MDVALLAALVVSITAGGTSHVASAVFQSRLRFGLSLASRKALRWRCSPGGPRCLREARSPGCSPVSSRSTTRPRPAWAGAFSPRTRHPQPGEVHSFLEGLSLLGITAAALILISWNGSDAPAPHARSLATFAVVATLVGVAVPHAADGRRLYVAPRLSRASTAASAGSSFVARPRPSWYRGAAAVLAWFAAPWIVERLLAGKYHLSAALMIAALVSGGVKIADAFATTVAGPSAAPGNSPGSTG